jgi:lysophospholipase L1-like esterase
VSPTPLRVVVIGDSTAFSDHAGPQSPSAAHLWPNVTADELRRATGRDVVLTVWARPGVDALEAWQALTKDRHLMFDVVGPADVVIVAIGSLDHAPAGLPPIIDAVIPRLRPDGLRRGVRRAVRRLHPLLVRLRGARGVRTPPGVFAERYARVLRQASGLTMDRAVTVALGPTSHRARHHGGVHPRREESAARQCEIARQEGYAVVPVWELVEPFADRLNTDGVHWPSDAHAAVGSAVARAIEERLSPR